MSAGRGLPSFTQKPAARARARETIEVTPHFGSFGGFTLIHFQGMFDVEVSMTLSGGTLPDIAAKNKSSQVQSYQLSTTRQHIINSENHIRVPHMLRKHKTREGEFLLMTRFSALTRF